MNYRKKIFPILLLMLPLWLFSQHQEWVTTYLTGDSSVVSITLGEDLINANEYSSPPQLKLTFSTKKFDIDHFSKQLDLAPLYRIDASEKFAETGKNNLIVMLRFTSLPAYSIHNNGNHVVVSWRTPETEAEPGNPLEEAFQFNQTGSLNFKDAPLLDILRLLAEQNNLNIIAGADIEGKVTVTLTDVNLGDALDAILKVNGYSWFVQGNIVVIKPTADEMAGELTTRVYKLEYADAISLATALENVLTKKGKVQVFTPIPQGGLGLYGSSYGGGGIGSITPYGGGGLNSQLGTGGYGQTGTQASLSGYTTGSTSSRYGGSSQGGLGGLGGYGNQQQTSLDHIIVTDIFANFDQIESVISRLDRRIEQINIAVKFIETKLTMDEKLGIDWTMRAELNAPVKTSADQTDLSSIVDLGKLTNLKIATLSLPVFQGIMDLLSSDGDTRLIQEPQTTTLNNTTATMNVGTTFPILVPQNSSTILSETQYSFEQEDINITLNVTPRINENEFISIKLNAIVEALVGMTGPNSDRPIISSRSLNNQVMVKDGETLLIGGLIFDQVIDNTKKVPILGDIPFLKKLFTHKSSIAEQRELLLFVTPNIVKLD
ncbi:MAG: hypothetical protein GXO91_09820 [FCB group bacterium]|nr:hypothetical protein [FCB group bacterium]